MDKELTCERMNEKTMNTQKWRNNKGMGRVGEQEETKHTKHETRGMKKQPKHSNRQEARELSPNSTTAAALRSECDTVTGSNRRPH